MPTNSLPREVDVSRPSIARVYDAMLGGKDNFDVDREMMQRMVTNLPGLTSLFAEGRAFLQRAVRWLATEGGIDQFLDLGSGLPTRQNVHEVARESNRDVTVVYNDNDPAAIAHGRALLADDDRTFFAPGDLTDPAALLSDPVVTDHLEFDRPMVMLQCATLHFVPGQERVEGLMREYIERLAPGSYVVLSHARQPAPEEEYYAAFNDMKAAYSGSTATFSPRSTEEIQALFTGLELVDPGVVPVREWWPDGPSNDDAVLPHLFMCGVGRKP